MSRPITYHLIRSMPSPLMASEHVPLVIVSKEDGFFLREAHAFFHDERYSDRSHSWRLAAAKTIGLFFDFFKASEIEDFGGAINQHTLVRNFLLAVSRGTILRDGEDPTGLRWKPSSPDRYAVRKSYLRQFLEALQDFSDEGTIIKTRFCQVAVSSRAREYQRARSLLYHLGTPRTYSGKPNDSSRSLGVLHKKRGFDQDVLLKLLQVGCRRSRSIPAFYNKNGEPTLASEFNLNLLMAIILMVGGGLRQSELFHIFLDDIRPDIIWMYHPEYGKDRRGRIRSDYLREEFGLLPRNRITGTQRAGWKRFLITDDQRMRSRLFLLPYWHELFYKVFYEYRRNIYPNNPAHPYLFVSTDARFYGQPWSIQGLKDSFKAAMNKAGMKQSKFEDTNMHAFRHSYGQKLVSMGLSPLYVKEAMHHLSIESQQVYTRPSDETVNKHLQEAAARMQAMKDGKYSNLSVLESPDLIGGKFMSDPAGIFTLVGLGRNRDRI
jgi:integrase